MWTPLTACHSRSTARPARVQTGGGDVIWMRPQPASHKCTHVWEFSTESLLMERLEIITSSSNWFTKIWWNWLWKQCLYLILYCLSGWVFFRFKRAQLILAVHTWLPFYHVLVRLQLDVALMHSTKSRANQIRMSIKPIFSCLSWFRVKGEREREREKPADKQREM